MSRTQRQLRMIKLLGLLAPTEGYNLTSLPDVRLLRSNRPLERTPVLYDPGIVVVCQGRKKGYFGDQTFVYDADHCLVVAAPVPFTMQTEASVAAPLLAIYFHLDLNLAAGLILELDEHIGVVKDRPAGMTSTPMDDRLGDAVMRLLEALQSPLDAAILGPGLVREIYYRVLMGDQSGSMRSALSHQGNFGRIGRALMRIHADFATSLRVEDLAREAAMSVPAFHVQFKAVTHTTPLQYVKSIRLHQARLLMLRKGMTAAAASGEVGYESATQFSREFKRLFNLSPQAEVARMKRDFAVPPGAAPSHYVSSH